MGIVQERMLQSDKDILRCINDGTATVQSNIQELNAIGWRTTIKVSRAGHKEYKLEIERTSTNGTCEKRVRYVVGTNWDAMKKAEQICGMHFGDAEWWGCCEG